MPLKFSTPTHSVFRNHLLRQEGPDCSHRREDAGRDEQEPIKDALTSRDLIPKDLQVEGEREDDTNGEAEE